MIIKKIWVAEVEVGCVQSIITALLGVSARFHCLVYLEPHPIPINHTLVLPLLLLDNWLVKIKRTTNHKKEGLHTEQDLYYVTNSSRCLKKILSNCIMFISTQSIGVFMSFVM